MEKSTSTYYYIETLNKDNKPVAVSWNQKTNEYKFIDRDKAAKFLANLRKHIKETKFRLVKIETIKTVYDWSTIQLLN